MNKIPSIQKQNSAHKTKGIIVADESGSDISRQDIGTKSIHGGLVTLGSRGITIAIQLLSTVVLARLLTPEDYGTLAMVTAITAFAGLFMDLGLSSAAIQKKGLTQGQQNNLFWLNVLMGVILTGLVAAAAPLISNFYNKPELLPVTMVLSVTFLIGSLSAQHGAMLIKSMRFGRKAFATIVSSIVALIVSVTLALNHYSYWALVWGNVCGMAVSTFLLVVLSPFNPGLPRRGTGVRDMLGFGANVTAFSFVNYFSRNLDNILIGRFLGTEPLGIYSKAYQLLMFPISSLRMPIESVAFPAMSKLDPKSEKFRSYYCNLVRLLSMVAMPLMAWMYVASDEIILVCLGKDWSAVTPVFTALAIVGFIQPVASLRGLILLSSGQARRYFKAGLITAFVVSLAFMLGIQKGMMGLVWAYVITEWFMGFFMHVYACKNTSIHSLDLLHSIYSSLIVSVGSIIIIKLIEFPLFMELPIVALIFIKGLFVGVLAFISLYFNSRNRHLVLSVLVTIFSKKKKNSPVVPVAN